MGGTARGSIEHYTPLNDAAAFRDHFVAIVQFLNNHPNWTRVACQGAGAGVATSWTYSSGVNPPGERAWAVYRKSGSNVFQVLVQWSFALPINGYPGDPADHPSGYYVGIQAAYDTSGGTDIFNGGPSLVGSNASSSVDTSSNNTLRIRKDVLDSYTVINVTAGVSTSKTTIRNDLNAAFLSNTLPFSARVESNQLIIAAANGVVDGNIVDIDTIANGSTLNTPVGFADGATVNIDSGTDLKGVETNGSGFSGAVWVPDGGNLIVLPRANGAGGTFTSLKQAMAAVTNGGGPTRFQIVGDDDYLWFGQDQNNDGNYDRCLYVGAYTPAAGVSVTGSAICMVQSPGSPDLDSNIGSTANTSSTAEGGAAEAAGTTQCRAVRMMANTLVLQAVHQPNLQRATPSYDTMNIPVCIEDTQGTPTYGLLGFIDLVRIGFDLPTHDTNVGLTKAFFGGVLADWKWIPDWDGTTVPGSGTTPEGVQF